MGICYYPTEENYQYLIFKYTREGKIIGELFPISPYLKQPIIYLLYKKQIEKKDNGKNICCFWTQMLFKTHPVTVQSDYVDSPWNSSAASQAGLQSS